MTWEYAAIAVDAQEVLHRVRSRSGRASTARRGSVAQDIRRAFDEQLEGWVAVDVPTVLLCKAVRSSIVTASSPRNIVRDTRLVQVPVAPVYPLGGKRDRVRPCHSTGVDRTVYR